MISWVETSTGLGRVILLLHEVLPQVSWWCSSASWAGLQAPAFSLTGRSNYSRWIGSYMGSGGLFMWSFYFIAAAQESQRLIPTCPVLFTGRPTAGIGAHLPCFIGWRDHRVAHLKRKWNKPTAHLNGRAVKKLAAIFNLLVKEIQNRGTSETELHTSS